MIQSRRGVLYVTPAADRFFLVPVGEELRPGDLLIVSVTGEECRVDATSLAPVEVTRVEALEHLRAQVKQAVSTLAERISMADARDGMTCAVGQFADDVRIVSAAIVSGDAAELTTAHERLAGRGVDLGATLDDLPSCIDAIRQLDQQEAKQAAAKGLHGLADAVEGGQERLGRRVDALLARLERELGPLVGMDRRTEAAARQVEYRRSATSVIGDSLRDAGITPLRAPSGRRTRKRARAPSDSSASDGFACGLSQGPGDAGGSVLDCDD